MARHHPQRPPATFHLAQTPNQFPEDKYMGYRDAILCGPRGWDPWKRINAASSSQSKHVEVSMTSWESPNYIRLCGTNGLPQEEIMKRAQQVLKICSEPTAKIELMELPKVVYGQHYPGYDKHPGIIVRSDYPIQWVHHRLHHLLNMSTTQLASQEGDNADLAKRFRASNPFFQSDCEGFAFLEFWASKRRPALGLDAAKVAAKFVGLELEVLPNVPTGRGLIFRHKGEQPTSTEILRWSDSKILAEVSHGGKPLGEITLDDLSFIFGQDQVPEWRAALKDAMDARIWDEPELLSSCSQTVV